MANSALREAEVRSTRSMVWDIHSERILDGFLDGFDDGGGDDMVDLEYCCSSVQQLLCHLYNRYYDIVH